MGIEVERKFLLADDSWRDHALSSSKITDGLISATENAKVRVRIEDNRATLTVKSPRTGMVRAEFEYPIPLNDAHSLMRTACQNVVLQKTRHLVPHDGFTWTVDIYEGELAGIGVAEIELTSPDQSFSLPPWVGREVTQDQRFHKSMLQRLCAEAGHPLSVAELLDAKV